MANDGKMDALKTASHNLLSQLQAAATHPEDVYVSIVPFSKDVNFGSDNYAASWLRWDLWQRYNAEHVRRARHLHHLRQIGWLSLVGGGPFPVVPKDPLYQYTDVIILLTDGLNTQNRWSTTQSDIDDREAMTCANIKAANVDLYTIQVNTGGDPTSTLLQNCASSTDKFYLLTSADQMTATFNTIGTNLTKLRVAQ